MRFAWGKLKPALEAAIAAGEVQFVPPVAPPPPPKKTTGKAAKPDNGIDDIANALTGKKKAPARK